MNTEKIGLYAQLYARAFSLAETADNNAREERHFYWQWNTWDNLFCFSTNLLDEIDEQAKKDLTKEEYEYFIEQTETPNRYDYE